jgi:hypothetical protein
MYIIFLSHSLNDNIFYKLTSNKASYMLKLFYVSFYLKVKINFIYIKTNKFLNKHE